MSFDYMPAKDAALKFWLQNIAEKLNQVGPAYGLSPAEIAQGQNACANMIAALEDFFEARITYRSKKTGKQEAKKKESKILRNVLNRMKAHPDFSEDNAHVLKIATRPYTVTHEDYQPEFRLQNWGNHIKVYFKKRGVTGVKIFCKLQGEKEFKLLDYRIRSPYSDERPLAQPSVPEVREYMLMGMKNDEPIGQFSNVKTIVFAGQ
jgi:hypothetical protein